MRELPKYEQQNLDILFSADCNMKCKYCYIEKTGDMKSANKIVRDGLKDGSLVNSYLKVASPEHLKSVGLWGAEPSLNFDCSEAFFKDLFETFPKIEEIMFSTNTLLGEKAMMEMVKSVDKSAHKLRGNKLKKIIVQMSLDGPDWVTDINRHNGAKEKIKQNYYNCLEKINTYNIKNIDKVWFSFKPTIPVNPTMRQMVEDDKKLYDYFDFFDSLVEEAKDIKVPGFVRRAGVGYPTLVNPGYHSSEEGKIFSKWIKKVNDKNFYSQFKNYTRKPFLQQDKFIEKMLFLNANGTKPQQLTCGGGYGSLTVDAKGQLFQCHRTLSLDSYNIPTNSERQILRKKFIANLDNDLQTTKMKIQGYSYHQSINLRAQILDSLIPWMVKEGQISEKYLENRHLRDFLILLSTTNQCFLDSSMDIGSVHVSSLSYVRLFGNGALSLIIKDILRDYKYERGEVEV